MAAIIRDEFDQTSMSQRALAPLVGVSPSQLGRLLRGEVVIDLQQLDAICRELGLSVREIVDAADFARLTE
ncbi:MAG: helix-turn-helix protein [Schumannella sp.]|nr:helix-turn-helix protein [Schumannella sp.]